MLQNFIGTSYRLADNWFNNIDINSYKNKQINYLGEKAPQIFIKKFKYLTFEMIKGVNNKNKNLLFECI
jgi:hypothetical protein